MARKTTTVTIPTNGDEPNRDAGKTFLLTEMSAVKAEKWATRALLAVANSGIDIPPEVIRMGAGALMAVGFRALLTTSFMEAEPLLDEMMQCVEFVPDPKKPDVRRPFDEGDVEEVTTLIRLRGEVVELHTGFSIAAFLSKMGAAGLQTTDHSSPDTPTSPS